MPRTRSRISARETTECRDRLLRLEQIGIATGDARNLSSKPGRLILEQIDPEFARVYDLPSGEVVVVVPAKLTVLESGVMIINQQMTTPRDEYVLDLSDPREHEHPSFQDLTQGLPAYPQFILNDFLVERSAPLGRGQLRGVIFATGWSSDPATYCEGPFLTMDLSLRDEQGNETYCKFRGEVDRHFRLKYERQQQERRLLMPLGKREGLYSTRIRAGDQTRISPKPNVSATSNAQISRPGGSISATKRIYRSTI